MPTSIDPRPKEDELECAQCGAYFFHQLTRCPECGANIFEPEDDIYADYELEAQDGVFNKIVIFFRRLFRRSDYAEALFKDALDYVDLYEELLKKVGADHSVANRLIDFEQQKMPAGTRSDWIRNAIERWERDNRIFLRKKK
jgi:hypothetical protein